VNVNEQPTPLGPDPLGSPASLRSRHLYRNARREPVVADPRPLNPGAPVIYARHRARLIIRWDRILGAIGAGLIVAFVAVMAFLVATDEPAFDPASLPVCVTEDSDNCHWFADVHGNGQGTSFYSLNGQRVMLP
jgi:hypothetical protein